MSKKAARWGIIAVVSVETIGFLISFYLFLISARVIYPENVPCPRGAIFACHSILRGNFSKLGPFSISALGVLYFALHLALNGIIKPKGQGALVKFGMTLCGLGMVAYLRSVEIVYLRKICPWCYGVALLTIVQACLVYGLAIPPLRKAKPMRRVLTVLGLFTLLIGVGSGIAFVLGSAERAMFRTWFPQSAPDGEREPAGAGEPPSRPAAETPKPHATPTPVAVNVSNLPSPKPSPSPPAATPATPQLPESDLDTAEAKLLRKHGWRIVPATEVLYDALKTPRPVMLLVFDPYCDECAYLINNQLTHQSLDDLPVLRIAIESNNLTGKLSVMIQQVPTVALVDSSGTILYNHVGRIEPGDLKKGITGALPK